MADPARDRREWCGPDYAWLIEVDTTANGPRLRLQHRRASAVRWQVA